MLDEIERHAAEAAERDARTQLELFGALLVEMSQREAPRHKVELNDGRVFEGTWEEIVAQMRVGVPVSDAERYIRGRADAGLLRIVD